MSTKTLISADDLEWQVVLRVDTAAPAVERLASGCLALLVSVTALVEAGLIILLLLAIPFKQSVLQISSRIDGAPIQLKIGAPIVAVVAMGLHWSLRRTWICVAETAGSDTSERQQWVARLYGTCNAMRERNRVVRSLKTRATVSGRLVRQD